MNAPEPPPASRAAEAVAVAAAGGALAGLVGSLFELTIPFAVVGGLNGAISGWRGIYRWRGVDGWAAFTLDSTWALGTTLAALVAHGLSSARRETHFVGRLSRRANRHVYEGGFAPRRGFAITLGNVTSGLGDTSTERRQRLVTDHEDVHVWQARWWGPLFPVLYVGWSIGGAAVGAVRWLGDRKRPLGRMVESHAYYLNPFEWWAYSRDDHWPPRGIVPGIGWKRPMVRPFSVSRAKRGSRAAPS